MWKFIRHNSYFILLIGIGLMTVLLRFGLTAVNREANDNHQNVVQFIMQQARLPGLHDLWEGFQPKLFHWSFAQTFLVFQVQDREAQIVVMDCVNTLMGLAVLLLLWRMLQRLPVGQSARFWTFALMACNPCVIGIFSQATNDAFVIFFATLAIYFLLRYLATEKVHHIVITALASILAGLSKGNGLVILPVLLTVLVLHWFVQRPHSGKVSTQVMVGILSGWLLAYFVIVPFIGQYVERYQETGSPFTTNMKVQPLPSLFSYSQAARPGVVSLVGSYLKFPFLGLIHDPVLTGDVVGYPAYRTSLWVVLYGQMNFAHFAQWPTSWGFSDKFLRNTGRGIYILALFPTTIVLGWFLVSILRGVRGAIQRKKIDEEALLHFLIMISYFAFLFLYTWEIRDYSTMKPVFLLPGMLSMSFFLARGLDWVFQFIHKFWPARIGMHGILTALIVLFTIDIVTLIYHVATVNHMVGA